MRKHESRDFLQTARGLPPGQFNILDDPGLRAFLEKDSYLEEHFEYLTPTEYFDEIFNFGVDLQPRNSSYNGKANAIAISVPLDSSGEVLALRRTIHTDDGWKDMLELPHENFNLIAPISYFGKNILYLS